MSRVLLAAALASLLAGCQTFIGIDDVQGHLPYLDGDYLVGLRRLRADGTTFDTIRLVGNAVLDPDTRELQVNINMLSATDGSTVSENAITGVVFPEDATEIVFPLQIAIPPAAVMNPSGVAADANVSASMIMHAEGDYAFCADPADGSTTPSIGSILRGPGTVIPEFDSFDTGCDDLDPQ